MCVKCKFVCINTTQQLSVHACLWPNNCDKSAKYVLKHGPIFKFIYTSIFCICYAESIIIIFSVSCTLL